MKTERVLTAALALLLAPWLRAADGSLSFDGAGDFVEVPNFHTLGITDEVTVEFWAKTTGSAQQSAFMLNPDVATNRFQAHISYFNGNTYWDFGDIGAGGRVSVATPAGAEGNWTHYALVASQSGNYMKIHINGLQAVSNATFHAFETLAASTLRIGGGTGYFFNGSLDDFRVWNVARDAADIRRDMTGPLTGGEDGLRLYFKFDEPCCVTALKNSATATGAAFNGQINGNPVQGSPPARTTYTVANANDTGAGSLRQALSDAAAASGPALIVFEPHLNIETIDILTHNSGTAIRVSDAGGVVIDASNLPKGLYVQRAPGAEDFRLFQVDSQTSLTLRGLSLWNAGGDSFNGNGGAIQNLGSLTLRDCAFTGNVAPFGAALHNSGSLDLSRCTFANNAGRFGAAVFNDNGGVRMTNCTLTGNSASDSGGALYNTRGLLLMWHCTFSGNAAGDKGGAARNLGQFSLTSSILSGNTADQGGPDLYSDTGSLTAVGGTNLLGDLSGSSLSTNDSILVAAPLLAPLADNGGPTMTMALLPGSPALDAGGVAILGIDTDQRGLPRRRDGNNDATAAPDIGAYEAQVAPVGSLGFNFNGTSPRDLAATDSAGAPGFAQTHWNNLIGDFGSSSSPRTLSGGGSATVRITFAANGRWTLPGTPATADQKLMAGHLHGSGIMNSGISPYFQQNRPFVALADLSAAFTFGGYRVVVYADTDAADGRVAEYWLTTHADLTDVTGATDLSPHLFLADNANFSGTGIYTRVPATSTARAGAAPGNYLVFEAQTQPAFILRTEDFPATHAVISGVQVVRNEILVVTTAQDENDPVGTLGAGLSLREAVALAPDGGGILFDASLSGKTVRLDTAQDGEIFIDKNLTIDASSLPGALKLDAQTRNRILHVSQVATLVMRNMVLIRGSADYGGAILNEGTLALNQCVLSQNQTTGGGAAIRNAGTLTLTLCTLSDNATTGDGGALSNSGNLAMSHCTLSANFAAYGGAILNLNPGTGTITHCTFSGNSVLDKGGAIRNESTLRLANSIVFGNEVSTGGGEVFNTGLITREGANIIRSMTNFNGGRDEGPAASGADPVLAPLGNYGGSTKTMALRLGSPARNAAEGSSATSDQRGFPIVGTPDLGAYESGTLAPNYQAFIWESLPVSSTPEHHDGAVDFDRDKVSNETEWAALTDPANGSDFLRLTAASFSNSVSNLTFTTKIGLNYRIQVSNRPGDGWMSLGPPIAGTGIDETVPVPDGADGSRTYRVAPSTAPMLELAMVKVGNPGNAADPGPNGLGGNSGAVAYEYRIGKYEVTNGEYAMFLNAVDPNGLNTLALYNASMASDTGNGGITFTAGNADGAKYAVKPGFANKPVAYVSFYDAMRFCNWLHNGAQAGGDTENGAYTLQGNTATPSNGATVTRNAGAKFAVPSEDEWYKAAYHQPEAQGGDTDHYWLYPTRSNSQPSASAPPGAAPAANFFYAVGSLTPVGAYTTTTGFYGALDMAGNMLEWADTIQGESSRVLRGGSWLTLGDGLRSDFAYALKPDAEHFEMGFRVASP